RAENRSALSVDSKPNFEAQRLRRIQIPLRPRFDAHERLSRLRPQHELPELRRPAQANGRLRASVQHGSGFLVIDQPDIRLSIREVRWRVGFLSAGLVIDNLCSLSVYFSSRLVVDRKIGMKPQLKFTAAFYLGSYQQRSLAQ